MPFRSLTTAVTFWTAWPRVMVQPMLPPTSTTRTLGAPGAPQRTVAARAVGWSSRRIRLTMRVTSMIGLAGSRAKRPPVPAAATARRVTGDGAGTPALWPVQDAFLYGADLLVAPVIEEGATRRALILPGDAPWRDVWTGADVAPGPHEVPAPIGRPPLFYRPDSRFAALFAMIPEVAG